MVSVLWVWLSAFLYTGCRLLKWGDHVSLRYDACMRPGYAHKLLNREAFVALRPTLRAQGVTLVHCHGCFDIVHPGHIRHLRFAAEQGDRLIVSVTPDRFVNKGPGRPMFGEQMRAESLAALEFVDWVVIHDQPTATGLLGQTCPEVYVKGAEYSNKHDERFEQEKQIVEASGGRVIFSDDDVVYSSSAIIESLRSSTHDSGVGLGLLALYKSYDLSSNTIAGCFERARGKRVTVLSESILDVYAHCRWPEIAQEHPMLSLFPDREESFDGGGAIIASHLAAMGLEVTLCTPLGADAESKLFRARMSQRGVEVVPIATDQPLPRKIRYLVDQKKVMKIDSSIRVHVAPGTLDGLVDRIRGTACDALVIADFGLGLFANKLASQLIPKVRDRVGMILGDVSGRRAQLGEMNGADVLCPCEVELRQMLDAEHEPLGQLTERALRITGVQALCVTRAAEGLQIERPLLPKVHLPAMCSDPVDVLGCGDALLTAMAACLLGGADHIQAGFAGSLAAAIQGETHGNIPISTAQVVDRARTLSVQLAFEQAMSHTNTEATVSIEPRVNGPATHMALSEYTAP